jgi:uncharacterized protein with NRDE domain
MCTLIFDFDPERALPVLIAANRDERLDRAASAPHVWDASPKFLAPRDEVAGGTWLGLNAAGVFVGVTNRFGVEKDALRRSRGALVVDALSAKSALELHQHLSTLDARAFNAFHLLYTDLECAFVTWSDGTKIEQQTLQAGVHIVTERSLGGEDKDRTEWIRANLPPNGETASVEQLFELLRHHGEDPLGGTCVHAPAFNYGTRSSLVMRRGKDVVEFFWSEGPACQGTLKELSGTARSVLQSSY